MTRGYRGFKNQRFFFQMLTMISFLCFCALCCRTTCAHGCFLFMHFNVLNIQVVVGTCIVKTCSWTFIFMHYFENTYFWFSLFLFVIFIFMRCNWLFNQACRMTGTESTCQALTAIPFKVKVKGFLKPLPLSAHKKKFA